MNGKTAKTHDQTRRELRTLRTAPATMNEKHAYSPPPPRVSVARREAPQTRFRGATKKKKTENKTRTPEVLPHVGKRLQTQHRATRGTSTDRTDAAIPSSLRNRCRHILLPLRHLQRPHRNAQQRIPLELGSCTPPHPHRRCAHPAVW